MARKQLAKNWWQAEGEAKAELPPARPTLRVVEPPPPEVLIAIPPFSGVSRRLLTRAEACAELKPGQKPCSLTFLDKQIRLGLLHPHPRGREVWIPIEEIENYNARAQMLYRSRHA
jgi:hypothetical protein